MIITSEHDFSSANTYIHLGYASAQNWNVAMHYTQHAARCESQRRGAVCSHCRVTRLESIYYVRWWVVVFFTTVLHCVYFITQVQGLNLSHRTTVKKVFKKNIEYLKGNICLWLGLVASCWYRPFDQKKNLHFCAFFSNNCNQSYKSTFTDVTGVNKPLSASDNGCCVASSVNVKDNNMTPFCSDPQHMNSRFIHICITCHYITF